MKEVFYPLKILLPDISWILKLQFSMSIEVDAIMRTIVLSLSTGRRTKSIQLRTSEDVNDPLFVKILMVVKSCFAISPSVGFRQFF